MKCKYRHEDNGNCTAVGGFCTAVTAAHCPLLRDFLDTGLTPDEIRNMSGEWCAAMSVLNGMGSYDRLRELLTADKDGRCIILPCKVGDVVYGFHNNRQTILPMVAKWIETNADGWTVAAQYTPMVPEFYQFSDFGKTVFLTREEAEKALQEMEGKP